MKRYALLNIAGAGVLSALMLVSCAEAKDKDKNKKQAEAAAIPAELAAKPGEKIAYTFSDQSKVDIFGKLWQQRQATVLRMTVLKSYFLEEEDTLKKLNDQFAKDYNLDVTKNYKFDSERKMIVEVDSSQAAPMPGTPATAAQ